MVIHSHIHQLLAAARQDELKAAAERARRARSLPAPQTRRHADADLAGRRRRFVPIFRLHPHGHGCC